MTDANEKGGNGPGVRFPPPFVYLGFLLIGLVLDDVLRLNPAIPDAVRWFGGLLVVLGLAVIVMAIGLFKRAGTNPEPWRDASAIVTTGLYRHTRNPMYLGLAIMHLGLALALDSLGAILMLPLAILAIRIFVIAREERYLSGVFGSDYETYKANVRRWI